MNILLLGGGLQGLACGSSLFHQGNDVDVVSDDLQIKHSVFFNRVYCGINLSLNSLYDILKTKHYDVIIPMGDKGTSFLSRHKEIIEDEIGTICACPSFSLLSIVEDKHKFMAFCHQNEIPHPKTFVLTVENQKKCAMEIGFPSLIKPDFSVGARGITRVDTLDELYQKLPAVLKEFGPCTLQEFVDNQKFYYNVMLYRDNKGRFLGHTVCKVVRMYPVNGGSSSCCISVENDDLLNLCKDCLCKLEWTGMADFDVLQCRKTGEYKIIEMNPRVPACLRIAIESGMNFPEIISLDALSEEVPVYPYIPGKTLRYLGLDMMWLLKSTERWKSNPCWLNIVSRDVYWQDIYRCDISTWWSWLAVGLKKVRQKNKRMR